MKLISIIGPTAIGKTSFSIEMAKRFKTEIISSDSRQMYREMNIGTAKPTELELVAVPHHFINSLSIEDNYSVGKYEKDVLPKLEELFEKYETVVMVGGSPLYEKAVIGGLDDFPDIDPDIRKKLNQQLEEDGIESLQVQLKVLDPDYYQEVDIQNPHRLIRALEVSMGTDAPYSSYLQSQKNRRPFEVERIGLTAPREIIYERINQRVDEMREQGLLEEARVLYPYKDLNALQTVGYQELFDFFDGKLTEDEAFEAIKRNTRRFAKRQLTWYRNDPSIRWVDWDKTKDFL